MCLFVARAMAPIAGATVSHSPIATTVAVMHATGLDPDADGDGAGDQHEGPGANEEGRPGTQDLEGSFISPASNFTSVPLALGAAYNGPRGTNVSDVKS
jgi:hypothetical protein